MSGFSHSALVAALVALLAAGCDREDRQVHVSPPVVVNPSESSGSSGAPSNSDVAYVIRSVSVEVDAIGEPPIPAEALLDAALPLLQRGVVFYRASLDEESRAQTVRLRDLPSYGRGGQLQYGVETLKAYFQAIVAMYTKAGFVGVYVSANDIYLDRGDLAITVRMTSVTKISFVLREKRVWPADSPELAWLRTECPLQVGDLIHGATVERFIALASERLDADVKVALKPIPNPSGAHVVFMVGAKKNRLKTDLE